MMHKPWVKGALVLNINDIYELFDTNVSPNIIVFEVDMIILKVVISNG